MDTEFLKFDSIESKRNSRPDINAFILLNELLPGVSDIVYIVCSAEHDQIWFDIKLDGVALTDDQVRDLVRCGVWYDSEVDSLSMFVLRSTPNDDALATNRRGE